MMNFGQAGDDTAGVKPLTSQELGAGGDNAMDESTLSATSGLAGAADGPDVSSRQTISGNVLLLVLVMAVAGGLLYGMRQVGLGVSLDFRTPSIDYPIENASSASESDAEHQLIIQDLISSETVVQVPLENLERNPFELESKEETELLVPGVDPAAAARQRAAAEAQRRQQEINRTFEGIEINSIMTGSVPLARINGQPVRIGDTVADIFTVRAISGRTVELEADGQVFRKSLGN